MTIYVITYQVGLRSLSDASAEVTAEITYRFEPVRPLNDAADEHGAAELLTAPSSFVSAHQVGEMRPLTPSESGTWIRDDDPDDEFDEIGVSDEISRKRYD